MNKTVFTYFRSGTKLANKNIIIYLIGLALSLTSLLPNASRNGLLSILYLFFLYVSFAYGMSIPLFLVQKQQNKSLEVHNLLNSVFKQAKRLVIPTIVFFILFPFLIFLPVLIVLINTAGWGIEPGQIAISTQNMINYMKVWNPIYVVFVTLYSFFVFVPIYFSLEEKGIFTSITRSAMFCCKHLNYFALVVVINLVTSFISNYISILLGNTTTTLLISTPLVQYINFIVLASSLLFFQDKNNF